MIVVARDETGRGMDDVTTTGKEVAAGTEGIGTGGMGIVTEGESDEDPGKGQEETEAPEMTATWM